MKCLAFPSLFTITMCSLTMVESVVRLPLKKIRPMARATWWENGTRPFLHRWSRAGDVGLLPLLNHADLYYTAPIQIGTPPQTFNFICDTGSADTFVLSTQCGLICELQLVGHHFYASWVSSSFKKDGRAFGIKFLDGSGVNGTLAQETVNLGGVVAFNQFFAEIIKSKGFFSLNDGIDGLMGLGFQKIASSKETPPIQNLIAHNALPEPVFTFYLSRAADGSDGQLTIGGIDVENCSGDITYVPIIDSGFWEFLMDGVTVRNAPLGSCTATKNVIADTGTSLVIGPDDCITLINQQIGAEPVGDGTWTIACDAPNLPTVSFVIQGRAFSLTGPDYIISQKNVLGQEQCFTGFAGIQGLNFWILGDVFLRDFCAIHDVGNRKIGFATAITKAE